MMKMISKILFSFSILLITISATAQDSVKFKIPKQYSLEFGYRNVFSVIDRSNVLGGNSAMHGYGFLFDYAWQLSGFNGTKPAAFITVPIGYTIMQPANSQSKQITMLNYGWTTRHELTKNQKFTPYIGYGLLLNTLKIKGTDGGVMGHQTRFELGTNLNTNTRLKYFAKIQYSYTSYPKLEDSKRMHFQFFDVRVGARF